MLFNSWPFLILVVATFIVYYLPLLRGKQPWVLIAASLVFYAYNSPLLLLLLLSSACINGLTSYAIAHGHRPKSCAVAGVVLNLSVLVFFKYSPLVGVSFFDTSNGIGAFLVSIPLPIGISFYTFQGISLMVDVYRGRTGRMEKLVTGSLPVHLVRTVFFIVFFPQLVAGPIVKAHEFFYQIGCKALRNICWENVFRALIVGYFLKMVVADNLKDFTFWMSYPYFENRGPGSLLLLLFGYSVQIFADFAGYSSIAIGVAGLFGYNLPRNFHFPYIASSFKEFWKRWHIALSTFLMEYLYIPLGGNRKGKARTYANLLLTMMLGGLWHGASWSFLTWGTYQGVLLAGERILKGGGFGFARREAGADVRKAGRLAGFRKCCSILFVFSMVTLGWLLFALPDFSHVLLYLKGIFVPVEAVFLDPKLLPIFLYSLPVVLYHLVYYFREHRMVVFMRKFDYIPAAFMLFLILTNSGSAAAFVYFQF